MILSSLRIVNLILKLYLIFDCVNFFLIIFDMPLADRWFLY